MPSECSVMSVSQLMLVTRQQYQNQTPIKNKNKRYVNGCQAIVKHVGSSTSTEKEY